MLLDKDIASFMCPVLCIFTNVFHLLPAFANFNCLFFSAGKKIKHMMRVQIQAFILELGVATKPTRTYALYFMPYDSN